MKIIALLLLLLGTTPFVVMSDEAKSCVGDYDDSNWTDGCWGSHKKGPVTKRRNTAEENCVLGEISASDDNLITNSRFFNFCSYDFEKPLQLID
ncbi:MAG: hypothetical protein CMO97_04780 [Woeseia sp.]|nr:hypothetical protein [Woeseia sp.]|tara:strand:+ start:5158 stop:5439 length:282 start_codon:yes stop_codon:yes gene_type:complete